MSSPIYRWIPRPGAGYTCRQCLLRIARRNAHGHAQGPYRNPKAPQKVPRLPDTPARTRFAPSPTGYLHLGSLRTALFNYLLAKATGGQFLLRLEDTDKKRTVKDAEKRLYDDLRWAGLLWDEGPVIGGPYGPYRQSERTLLYQKHAHKLISTGHAYRCFCTSDRLASLAEQRSKLGLPTDYDRTCANIPKEESDDRASKGESHVIRLKVPDVYPDFNDLVYGLVGKEKGAKIQTGDAWEDPILLKSDGLPTYNLANVVDDHHMKITHVIRGTEWMAMTPKHLAMYEAFGWEPPQFAHVGLLTEVDGQKLSKRMGSIDVKSYREQGVLPQALLNFVALLGWSHKEKSDFMTLDTLIRNFSLKFTRGLTAVNLEKLWFLQTKHVVDLAARDNDAVLSPVVEQIVGALEAHDTPDLHDILAGRKLEDYVATILRADAKNYTTPSTFTSRHISFFQRPDPALFTLQNLPPLVAEEEPRISLNAVKIIHEHFEPLLESKEPLDHLKFAVREIVAKVSVLLDEEITQKVVYRYLRLALAGGESGVGLREMMEILGREETVGRLRRCLEKLNESAKEGKES